MTVLGSPRAPETGDFHQFSQIPEFSSYFCSSLAKTSQNACIIKVFYTYFYKLLALF